ncbi:MAG: hypothetical protein JXK07_14710 [Spirochaetes bacterium]|nr:hypothetical protein [Spirochaetota bacterium]
MTKIIVIGASGVLGGLICTEILNLFKKNVKLFIGDYKSNRGKITADYFNAEFCETNIDDLNELSLSLSGKDLVIITINQKEPVIQKLCLEKSIPCIDITAFYSFAKKVQTLYNTDTNDNKSTSIIMAGFWPGLSGLLLTEALKEFDEVYESNISLIQNTNAKAGASGIVDMLKIISEPVNTMYNDTNITLSGFSLKRKIKLPFANKEYTTRLISHSEKQMLSEKLPVRNINYWTTWNNCFFNLLISIMNKTKLLNIIVNKIDKNTINKIPRHDAKKSEETILVVDVKGKKENNIIVKKLCIKTFSDYGTTAKIVAALARESLTNRTAGVCLPLEITTLNKVLKIINDERIEYYDS